MMTSVVHRKRRYWRSVLLSAVAMLASAGCTDPATSVPTASIDTMTQQVDQLATQVAEAGNEGKVVNPNTIVDTCNNDVGDDTGSVQYVTGFYKIELPPARQQAALSAVRKSWQQRGWIITSEWVKSVSLKSPTTSANFTLSMADEKGLALIVCSECFRVGI
jgi:hypothetical protein